MNCIRTAMSVLLGTVMMVGVSVYFSPIVDAEFIAKPIVGEEYYDSRSNPGWNILKVGKKKNAVTFTLDIHSATPSLQVKEGKSLVLTKTLSTLTPKTMWAYEVADTSSKRTFYIVGVRGDNEERIGGKSVSKLKSYEYILGKDSVTGTWKTYADVDDYYFPQRQEPRFAISHGTIMIRANIRPRTYSYKLTWDEKKDAFSYVELGEVDVPFFSSSLAENPKYRPIKARMDWEAYLDVGSIKTIYEDDRAWVFTARIFPTERGNELFKQGSTGKYQINRITRDAWYWDDTKSEWVYYNVPHISGFEQGAFAAVNWATYLHYGYFLHPEEWGVKAAIQAYKGK